MQEIMTAAPTVTRSTGAPAAMSQIAKLRNSIFPHNEIMDTTPLSPPITTIKNSNSKPSIINMSSSPSSLLISSSQM